MRTRLIAAVLAALVLCGPALLAEEKPATGFPDEGLLPKKEIGADKFLADHPEADGRGITVAIFDTGVDPGAPGLQTTTDGKPKIVDLVDGSGSGDVSTTTVRSAKDGKLKGLSGRMLDLGKHVCPKNEWHVGLKPAFELFPAALVARLKKKRKKQFDEKQRAVLVALERAHVAAEKAKSGSREARELKTQLEQLKALGASYKDPGPIYDCVVFHDGKVWRALIDTDEDGELGDEKAMTNYRLERQWSTFSGEDRLNYGINIYDEGKRLSIVADCGAHGTHVAGIVAAHYPDQPELNGVAPGAQIVAVKIGDTRMGSNSMGTGEERGLIAVLQNKCDLINMSYGGASPTPNKSRMEKLYAEIINEHNVIFVASAGNEGPALSTVGAPGGTSSAIFGVGAYVSPEMMRAQYAMRKTTKGGHFTWSSRGPTLDGAMGVDFSAPGGAIAPVPNWLLQGSTQMNGTSMSSPNLCGAVALILSGLKQSSIGWSPHRVKRALANTAVRPEGIDVFGMGHGLIQVPEAYDYITRWRDRAEEDVRFDLTLRGRDEARGLYLREPGETDRVAVERVHVKPAFREEEDHESRIAFSMRLKLVASQPWIEVPEHLAMQHGGGRFEVRVDPRTLERGKVHFGEVRAIDVNHPGRGAIFHLPVTVVRPEIVEGNQWKATLPFKAGSLERKFFAIPRGATWADLRLRTKEADASRLMILHTQQLLPGHSSGEDVFKQYVRMDPGEVSVHSFKVTGGGTLELALAQYWSSLGEGTFDAELVFHGLVPSSEVVRLGGGDVMGTVDVSVPFGRERLKPRVKLTTLRRAIRPHSFTVTPGDALRDKLPRGRVIHEGILEYRYELKEDVKVQPLAFQALQEEIYEAWSSSLWMIFDENKRLVARGPIFGDKTVSLKKGKYVQRVHVRHDDLKRLEIARWAPLYLDFKLRKPPSVGVFPSGEAVLAGTPGFRAKEVQAGDRVRLYLKPPARKAMGKLAERGDAFYGEIRYGEEVEEQFGKGRRPGGWPIWVSVPPTYEEEQSDHEDDEEPDPKAKKAKEPSAYETVLEELLAAKVAKLAGLRTSKKDEAFDKLAAAILKERPGYEPVLLEQLKRSDREKAAKQDSKSRRRVIAAADRLIERIDTKRLAEYRGSGVKPKSKAEKRKHQRMEMRRKALAEALFRKARALSYSGEKAKDDFIATWRELTKWTEVEGTPYLATLVRYERARGRPGAALKAVQAKLKKHPLRRELYEARMELIEALGWDHWVANERSWMSIRFPPAYPPF